MSAQTLLQVLVYHDLLGMMQHPHYVKVTPKFCKQYASVGTVIQEALQSYKDEVSPLCKPWLIARFRLPVVHSRMPICLCYSISHYLHCCVLLGQLRGL